MKKIVLIVCLIMVVGCRQKTPKVDVRIMSPYGAPSIALISTIKSDPESVTLVSGADLLLAELVRPTPEYELVIAPINLGISLIKKEQTNYRLLAVVSWGNLYVVGSEGALDNNDNTLAMFGKDAVPQKVADFALANENILAQQVYFPSVMDASAQLLTNKAQAALMAEPFASKTLQENPEFELLLDVQASYKSITGLDNYPQAALFVDQEAFKKNPQVYLEYVTSFSDYLKDVSMDHSLLIKDINEIGAKELGLPGSEILSDAFERMNIDVVLASKKKAEISAFMELFKVDVVDSMMVDGS